MIEARAPLRVSLFGGGTDYPAWFRENGGLVIGTAIRHYAHVRLPIQGAPVHQADLPPASGLGSSASFAIAEIRARCLRQGRIPSPYALATEGIRSERARDGDCTGIQDSILAAYGGFCEIRIAESGEFSVERVPIAPEFRNELFRHALLGFTGVQRRAASIARDQVTKILDGSTRSAMRELHEVAKEASHLLRSNPTVEDVARLLDESWRIKRNLSPSISTREIEDSIAQAKRLGARAAKVTGAGGGGFILFLAPPECHRSIRAELSNLSFWSSVEVEEEGARAWSRNSCS